MNNNAKVKCYNCGAIVDLTYNVNKPKWLQKKYVNKREVFDIKYSRKKGYRVSFKKPPENHFEYFCDKCLFLYDRYLQNIESINNEKKIAFSTPYKIEEIDHLISHFTDKIINHGGYFKDFKLDIALLSALKMAKWESVDIDKTNVENISDDDE